MSLRVLVVEDDDVLRDMYALRLSMEGYAVDTASDGLDGLAKVGKAMPDIVLLDMLMPRLDGLGFLGRFNKLAHAQKAIVIVASNMSSSQSIESAKRLGAVDYLVKSKITPDDLAQCVSKHIAGRL